MDAALSEHIDQVKYLTGLVEQQQAALKAASAKLQPAFETYIVDQSVPLNERWEFWIAAPKELKKEAPWVEHFELDGKELSWYDDFYIERHQTAKMHNIVESMEESLAEDDENPSKYEWTSGQVQQMKEAVLQKNLYSFECDW